MRELESLAVASRSYGANPEFVFLGGGNTSYKTADRLFIKPSGVTLADIQADDFIAMDRSAIRALYAADMPAAPAAREELVKNMMAAAVTPPGAGRPSVEAPLHELVDYAYVIHLHPAKINGMTCAVNGPAVCEDLFPDALWVDYIDPGATLAMEIKAIFDAVEGEQPRIIFLQNHGVFVGADTLEEIDAIYARIMATLTGAYMRAGVSTTLIQTGVTVDGLMDVIPALRGTLGDDNALPVLKTAETAFEPATGPLTPDHMVYAKSYPCSIMAGPADILDYADRFGFTPRVLLMSGGAVIGVGKNLKAAEGVLTAARDAALVQQLTRAFGGPRFLGDTERLFIENWEVESYRQKIAGGTGADTSARGKVCVVTGGAQGFGLGIAEGLAAVGAVVVLADVNIAVARQAAAELNARFGADSAVSVEVNIADEGSVQRMIKSLVLTCGGVDLFIANAGVLKAGSVKELPLADWEFVTKVNYTGYFLCVKAVAPVMARQNAARPGYWTDIVQINSKSGLEGSNRNGAYAGSKFGTIGLTQSFAMELVTDRIKVNSVCPGNFFDGPLWSDPERGLFVQYLRSKKVPGAKTVADVKAFYEAKVPMGRGCYPADVLKAILYLTAQTYETGQALPVTGGQVMLN
ncbi:MAG: SDR family NAD(P)-dependent oxidoreductase [Lentisphaeria bacterium]|nr:SDR family NAD(P)-dependent oxidoreductase [Lentisphaeria bacterium]